MSVEAKKLRVHRMDAYQSRPLAPGSSRGVPTAPLTWSTTSFIFWPSISTFPPLLDWKLMLWLAPVWNTMLPSCVRILGLQNKTHQWAGACKCLLSLQSLGMWNHSKFIWKLLLTRFDRTVARGAPVVFFGERPLNHLVITIPPPHYQKMYLDWVMYVTTAVHTQKNDLFNMNGQERKYVFSAYSDSINTINQCNVS